MNCVQIRPPSKNVQTKLGNYNESVSYQTSVILICWNSFLQLTSHRKYQLPSLLLCSVGKVVSNYRNHLSKKQAFVPKGVRLALTRTNTGLLKISFSTFSLTECLPIWAILAPFVPTLTSLPKKRDRLFQIAEFPRCLKLRRKWRNSIFTLYRKWRHSVRFTGMTNILFIGPTFFSKWV